MNLGQLSRGSSQCLGAIFDLSLGSNIPSGSGNPSWVVGDTFLVCKSLSNGMLYADPPPLCALQKNVYSVYRASPPSVGFAQLSSVAGGSGGCNLVFPVTSSLFLLFQAPQAAMVPQRRPRALEAAVRFPLVSAYLFLTSHFTADGGSSTTITLPAMVTTAMIAVLMCLL